MIAQITPLLRLPSFVDYFDYFIPPALRTKIKPGCLVKIPWRGGYAEGAVLEIKKTAVSGSYRARPISSLLLDYPVLTGEQLFFLRKFSAYYFTTWGYAVRLALPGMPKRAAAAKNQASKIIDLHFPIAKSRLAELENFYAAGQNNLNVKI